MLRFDMSQVAALSADLGKASGQATKLGQVLVRATAANVERAAKTNAPVDTGNLRNSITTQISGGGMTAEIGPAAAYGIYVEMGTRRMRPQPYMLPALQSQQGAFEQAVSQIVDGLL